MIEINFLSTIQLFIENEMENQIKEHFNVKSLEHNHPPLRFKVDGCEYCKKYGNIFEK